MLVPATRQNSATAARPHVRCRHPSNTIALVQFCTCRAPQECGLDHIRQIRSQPPGPMTATSKRGANLDTTDLPRQNRSTHAPLPNTDGLR